jgi:DNA-binding beta-propeller fold protein YncE
MSDLYRRRSAVILAVLGGAVLAMACADRPPVGREDEPLAGPEDPVEPNFSRPFDPSLLRLQSPVRMAVTPSGGLLVSDSRSRVVLRVNATTLQPDQALLIDGKPLGVGLWGGRVFVGNADAGTVDVFGPDGTWQYSFGSGTVPYPSDLAIDHRAGLVFVVAGGTREIKVFTLDGDSQGTLAGPGPGQAGLRAPTGIAVDENRREVLVSDYGEPGIGAAVKIFDYDGNYLAEISGNGDCGMLGCSEGFSRPQGIAVDPDGRIYLADALLGRVLVFDRATGQALPDVGAHVADGGTLRVPLDVVLGKDGQLIVASNGTASIERVP